MLFSATTRSSLFLAQVACIFQCCGEFFNDFVACLDARMPLLLYRASPGCSRLQEQILLLRCLSRACMLIHQYAMKTLSLSHSLTDSHSHSSLSQSVPLPLSLSLCLSLAQSVSWPLSDAHSPVSLFLPICLPPTSCALTSASSQEDTPVSKRLKAKDTSGVSNVQKAQVHSHC